MTEVEGFQRFPRQSPGLEKAVLLTRPVNFGTATFSSMPMSAQQQCRRDDTEQVQCSPRPFMTSPCLLLLISAAAAYGNVSRLLIKVSD